MRKFYLVSLISLAMLVEGCAQTMNAVRHAKLQTNVKMSDTIFLDAEQLAKNKNIYVRITNTSQMQNISLRDDLLKSLKQKGYSIVQDPSMAWYILQANVLYMDYLKKDLTADGMLAGGFGGVIAGTATGGDNMDKTVAGAVAGAVGSLAGAAVGSMVHVDTFVGTVDVQIKERVEGGVTGTMTTDASQGSASKIKMVRKIKSDFQTYRTRIVATATQTNINREKASEVLSGVIVQQIAGVF